MADNIISLHRVSHQYSSGILALNNINAGLPEGKKIALLGGNGVGKSTLMFMLNGILRPSQGFLSYKGEKITYKKKALRALRSKVGFLFQDSDNQLLAPTVYEEISFGLNNLGKDKDLVRKEVDEAIEAFCLQNLSERPPYELSAGQKKRVCLASVLAMKPELVVCDEPTSNLDPKHSKLTMNFLDNLNREGKTILIATHDVNMAYEWAEHIIILNEGCISSSGCPKEVFSNKKIIEEAGLNVPYIIQISEAISSNLKTSDLPSNSVELEKLLKQKLCKDF